LQPYPGSTGSVGKPEGSGGLQRTPDRRLAALVLARELGHRLAVGVALGNAFALALIKHTIASRETSRMLAFAPLQELIRGMSEELSTSVEVGIVASDARDLRAIRDRNRHDRVRPRNGVNSMKRL
jgi:hypothetical protein